MEHKRLIGRMTATALSAVMGCSGLFLLPAQIAYAEGYQKVNGYYQMRDGAMIEDVVARGIDVSRWQGDVDWNAVADDDVTFVMLGTRSKGAVDPFFEKNVKEASEAGIQVGAYIYSLATTPQMAVEEADFVLDLIKDYPISFPISFDAEDASTLGSLPPDQVTEIINAFCDRVEEAGYYPIVYANDNWLSNKIDTSILRNDVWVARYEKKHNYSDPIMWQATSSGSVDGITGNVDINFLYKDLTPSLPNSLWRTIGDKTYYYKDFKMQKDSWIDDGTGWFYMNEDGLASTGWLEKQGLSYYLDEADGRMATSWKQLDHKWYFFNSDGVMSTGWLDDNGAKYFLNSDGSMAFGWHAEGDHKYFLTDSGQAASGWQTLDGARYYFNQDGDMARGWINLDGGWRYLNQDGQMQSGWLTVEGSTYYADTDSGMITIGWRDFDGSWYYFNDSGAMATGLTQINGTLYYFDPSDGKMAVSTTFQSDGNDYSVDAEGICSKVEETADDTTPEAAPDAALETTPNAALETTPDAAPETTPNAAPETTSPAAADLEN